MLPKIFGAPHKCPKCFVDAIKDGTTLTCKNGHRYTHGKQITYTSMTMCGPDGTHYGVFRAVRYTRGGFVIDLCNARNIESILSPVGERPNLFEISKRYETPEFPAWDFKRYRHDHQHTMNRCLDDNEKCCYKD